MIYHTNTNFKKSCSGYINIRKNEVSEETVLSWIRKAFYNHEK